MSDSNNPGPPSYGDQSRDPSHNAPQYPGVGANPPANYGGYGDGAQGGYPQPYSSGPGDAGGTDTKGFFGSLFDLSFRHFITPKIVKFAYVLSIVGLLVLWLVLTIGSFTQSAGAGLAVLILGALGVLIYLCLIRMTLEFYVAIVRMSEDIHQRLPR